jgi:transcriptional regulator with XRE-family HTH domain
VTMAGRRAGAFIGSPAAADPKAIVRSPRARGVFLSPAGRRRKRPESHMPAQRSTAADIAIGRNVRIRRLAKGLSQEQLAKGLGVTFQQVQKYERGANRIGSGRLVRIAQVLELPIAALLEGTADEADEPADQSRAALIADRRAFRLAQAFGAIEDPAFRLSIIDMVEKLAALPQPQRGGTGPKRRRR